MDGILVVDKPKGLTSHDVVDFIRNRFAIKKVGHAGTLDPAATGVLVILLGRATKLADKLISLEKEYYARLTLGVLTDTADSDGMIIRKQKISKALDLPFIEKVFKEFVGEIKQVPPMFSAIHHKGKRLYELAREGISVPRRERKVNIKRISVRSFNLPDIDFEVVCSKGTYIRSLCEDIAKRLGCIGYLSSLRRIRCGQYNLDKTVTIKELTVLNNATIKNFILDMA